MWAGFGNKGTPSYECISAQLPQSGSATSEVGKQTSRHHEPLGVVQVNAALTEALKKGTSFGAPCYLENVLAEMVIDAVPSIEMVRFVNSGTEACMGMLRLARAYTGRDKVLKFDGCYHGHADSFLVQVRRLEGVRPWCAGSFPGASEAPWPWHTAGAPRALAASIMGWRGRKGRFATHEFSLKTLNPSPGSTLATPC